MKKTRIDPKKKWLRLIAGKSKGRRRKKKVKKNTQRKTKKKAKVKKKVRVRSRKRVERNRFLLCSNRQTSSLTRKKRNVCSKSLP
jgi:hypothetical protein